LDDEDNLALACRSCNVFKSDCVSTSCGASQAEVRLFHPRADDWYAHFDVKESGELVGKSEIGQATVDQLRMNSPAQMAARRLWIQLGLFP
jgi:hypothetical protein